MLETKQPLDVGDALKYKICSCSFYTSFWKLMEAASNGDFHHYCNNCKLLIVRGFFSVLKITNLIFFFIMQSAATVRRSMASISSSMSIKHGISLWCPQSPSLDRHRSSVIHSRSFHRRNFVVSASSSFANENREFVIVGGGNAAGYAARTFVEEGMADGKLCIVSKEAFAPYERPALTKGYLFPLDKKPARLPGFHTCVGSGGERQTPDWYKEKGIEMIYEDPVTAIDAEKQTLTTNSGKLLKYGSLIIATGCTASRFPEKIGGNLRGVHYIRDVADADSLISSLGKAQKVVVVGGGYIGMEVAAATVGWKLDTTVIFPEDHLLPRLFTPSLAQKYEELYQENGVKFVKGASIKNLEAGPDGNVTAVKLENGSTIEADLVVIGIGAKPAVSPFDKAVGLNSTVGGIQVDGLFRSNVPGIFAVGDVAAFPLKMYNRVSRVEHVDHARGSAQHCVKALLTANTHNYDYLPYFYSRVFEYEGTSRKVWWQFFGDNVGEAIQIGNFDPKIATFWLESGKQQQNDRSKVSSSPPVSMPPYGTDDDVEEKPPEKAPTPPSKFDQRSTSPNKYIYRGDGTDKSKDFLVTGRPSTKVKSVPGGDSSLGYLFGDNK